MIGALLLVGLSALPRQSSSPEKPGAPGFSGTWERDPDRSDDAQEKMRAAFERMQEEMERRGRGGFPPPGGPPPGGSSRPEGRGGGPGQVPEELEVEHEDGELRLDDGERLQIFYLDGQKHRRAMPNGAKLETVATLQGQVVLIPFPFTDLTATKQRPAIILSSDSYNRTHPDLILAAITSQVPKHLNPDEFLLSGDDLKAAGLPKPSIIKLGKIVTIDKRLARKTLGKLSADTINRVMQIFQNQF